MKIGDLVKYTPYENYCEGTDYGIITKPPSKEKPRHSYVVWFCDNEGWWNHQLLEVVSETR